MARIGWVGLVGRFALIVLFCLVGLIWFGRIGYRSGLIGLVW